MRVEASAGATTSAPSCTKFRPCIDIHKVRLSIYYCAVQRASMGRLLSKNVRFSGGAYRNRLRPHAIDCLPHLPLQGKVKQIVGSTLKDLPGDKE